MRLASLVLVVVVVASVGSGAANADDKVNLLTSTPSTIAVSSTVDNAAIKPEHIADGKLDTAWNSRTGDFAPHVLVRVPATAKVSSVKLTAGFTKVDKKLGDLFTMNPRIKKVRVTAGAKTQDFDLDIAKRDLQELTIDLPGGDIDIAVLAYEPGTKKTWREISISELEVWGTTSVAPKPQKPAVRLRSLDALPVLTKAECAKLVGKLEGKVASTDEVAVSADTTVCRIDSDQGEGSIRVTLAAASRKTMRLLGVPITIDLENGKITRPVTGDEYEATETVDVSLTPLRTSEQALSVVEHRESSNMYQGTTTTKTTLYRVDASGLDALIGWESVRSSDVEGSNGTECTGPTITPTAAMPKRLKVVCIESKGDWWNEDPAERGIKETKTTKKYVWNGTSYDEN
jgi:hypothetical protein